MATNDDYRPTIPPIPDEYTAEAIMYGSAYRFYKSATYYWDQVEDQLKHDIESLKGRIRDRQFAAFIMSSSPYTIFSNPPPFDEPDKIRDCWTLREIVRKGTALYDLQLRRTENRMWAEMVGVSEYAAKLNESGITEERWKSATLGQMVPIEFETIRAHRDYDELEAKKETAEYLENESRARAEADRLKREFDEFVKGLDDREESDDGDDRRIPDREVDNDEDVEVEDAPDIPIYREILEGMDDDDDGDDWQGPAPYRSAVGRDVLDIVRWMGYDPALETIAALSEVVG